MKPATPVSGRLKIMSFLMVTTMVLSGCLGGGDGAGKNLEPSAVVTVENGSNVLDYGEPLSVTARSSTDTDGEIVAWYWDFGDGETVEKKKSTHSYDNPGSYIVTLTVEDNKGAQKNNHFFYTSIDVLPQNLDPDASNPPKVVLVANPSRVQTGGLVDFNAEASWAWTDPGDGELVRDTGAITSYEWDFGDGNTDTGATTDHSWELPGNYPVKLTIAADNGQSTEYIHSILVVTKPAGSKGIKNPSTFTYVSIGEPEWLDPAHTYETAGGQILENVYETLVWYDGPRTDKLVPLLAKEVPTVENGLVSENGKNYKFNLRQGVMFQESRYGEMTADDVAYSIERAIEMDLPDGPAWMLTQVLNSTGIKVTGSYSVEFELERPYPAFLHILAYTVGSIVSKEYVQDHGGYTPGERSEWMDENAMGTGPYYFDSWEKGQHIILKKHDNYWRGWDDDRGYVDTVIIQKNTELTSRELALLSGEADYAYVPVTNRGDIEGKAGITIRERQPTFRLSFIGFNFHIENYQDTAPSADFFNNTDLRKAFCYAFDYDQFVEDIMAGSAFQARGPIPEGMLGHDSGTSIYEYDLDRAEDHFKDAEVWDAGFEITTYYNLGNTIREDGLLMLENTLETMNPKFKVNVQGLEWPEYLAKFRAKELPLFFLGWAPDYADPDDYIHPFLHSEGHYPYYLSYNNPEMDRMIEEASEELDPDVRVSLYGQIMETAHDEAVFIWAAQAYTFRPMRSWVQGYEYNPMRAEFYYYDMWKE